MGIKIENYFGIDFGTTSSATVGYSVLDHIPECFQYGDEEGRPIPSVVVGQLRRTQLVTTFGRESSFV